jgi:hypothetical protein
MNPNPGSKAGRVQRVRTKTARKVRSVEQCGSVAVWPAGRLAAGWQPCIFFRWEPAPILVCVEDLIEDLDYVSKKCTSTTRLPYSLHFPLLSFTKQGGRTPKSKPITTRVAASKNIPELEVTSN